jgi:methylmalonyl-CoA/ethylmalonyl-CoA epimerase
MDSVSPRRVHHIDVVVRDLALAVERFAKILGSDPDSYERLVERGVDLARFRVGETWLILVQPTRDDGPVAEYLDVHGEGFFHIGLEVSDVGAAADRLTARGVRLASTEPRFGVDGWRLVDIELDETCGAMMQLVEEGEG